jgi:hypothetical protein
MKTCKTSVCTACQARPVHARGYCTICYQRAYRAGLIAVAHAGPHHACTVAGCARLAWAPGYCNTHYMRVLRHGDPLVCGQRGRPRQAWVCSICDRPHYARGFCRSHYAKWLAGRPKTAA